MIEQHESVNHIAHYPAERSILLSANSMNRLRTLYGRVETRTEVQKEMERSVEVAQAALREYVSELLDMRDMPFSQNDRFVIDWSVGKITLETAN